MLERRKAKRYNLRMRVEVWPEGTVRGAEAEVFTIQNVSVSGFYFLTDKPFDPEARFNFAVLLPHKITGGFVDLIVGQAKTVRVDVLPQGALEHFAVAAAIEQSRHFSSAP